MNLWRAGGAILATVVLMSGFACVGALSGTDVSGTSDSQRDFPLKELQTAQITVDGNPLRVWLAVTPEQRTEGLMWVREQEIADDQGMLFVFPDEAERFFWMRNTITPLDIAYARMNGEIVMTHTMPALTLRNFPSVEPAMLALEVKAGTFERLGIEAGERMDVPADVFKLAE